MVTPHVVNRERFCTERGGGLSLAKFSKRGAGLTGSQFLERAAWKEGVIFFREVGLQFLNK